MASSPSPAQQPTTASPAPLDQFVSIVSSLNEHLLDNQPPKSRLLPSWKRRTTRFVNSIKPLRVFLSADDARYGLARAVILRYVASQIHTRLRQRLATSNFFNDRVLGYRLTLLLELLSRVDNQDGILATIAAAHPDLLLMALQAAHRISCGAQGTNSPLLQWLVLLLGTPAYFEALLTSEQLGQAFCLILLTINSQPNMGRYYPQLAASLLQMAHYNRGLRAKITFILRLMPSETARQSTLERALLKALSLPSEAINVCRQCGQDLNAALAGRILLDELALAASPTTHDILELPANLLAHSPLVRIDLGLAQKQRPRPRQEPAPVTRPGPHQQVSTTKSRSSSAQPSPSPASHRNISIDEPSSESTTATDMLDLCLTAEAHPNATIATDHGLLDEMPVAPTMLVPGTEASIRADNVPNPMTSTDAVAAAPPFSSQSTQTSSRAPMGTQRSTELPKANTSPSRPKPSRLPSADTDLDSPQPVPSWTANPSAAATPLNEDILYATTPPSVASSTQYSPAVSHVSLQTYEAMSPQAPGSVTFPPTFPPRARGSFVPVHHLQAVASPQAMPSGPPEALPLQAGVRTKGPATFPPTSHHHHHQPSEHFFPNQQKLHSPLPPTLAVGERPRYFPDGSTLASSLSNHKTNVLANAAALGLSASHEPTPKHARLEVIRRTSHPSLPNQS
ncbi:uncharacterized protein MONBRDRAFT_24421 [Monosiga brevicollis MX1]|uniref:Uncharacterized protein n=1 Tax=Monosiga brevicollis TaxID=81824 RepID=A9UWD4_MONBE|nr:uncharacterized protein MONBRDRAFT_24421 [Monosiga brevicollis MX1]EDQ90747.1 predicted protein [Monosiga brevicollis MX1]|eukprot:XP_001744798.1 hypothetical protein [Monosiga brevicollis MX1]